jgi:hypothetical protein
MSRMSLRVTVIDTELPGSLKDELQAWLEARVPNAIVEVRRTITSGTTPQDG